MGEMRGRTALSTDAVDASLADSIVRWIDILEYIDISIALTSEVERKFANVQYRIFQAARQQYQNFSLKGKQISLWSFESDGDFTVYVVRYDRCIAKT